MSQVEFLDERSLAHIFVYLGTAIGLRTCQSVCNSWKAAGDEDSAWKAVLATEFKLHKPQLPPGLPLDPKLGPIRIVGLSSKPEYNGCAGVAKSYNLEKERYVVCVENDSPMLLKHDNLVSSLAPGSSQHAWRCWEATRRKLEDTTLNATLYLRAAAAWGGVESWLKANELTNVMNTLRPGVSAEEWRAFVRELNLKSGEGLTAMRLLYSIHDGQSVKFDELQDAEQDTRHEADGIFVGLFGGYSAYNEIACTRLFPLKRILLWQRKLFDLQPSAIVVAANFNMNKVFLLDLNDGRLKLWQPRDRSELPAVPHGDHDLLRWMEEYGQRLRAGMYCAGRILPDDHEANVNSMGINLFPQNGPLYARSVTRGIEVTASSVLAYEAGSHVYSIRVRILPVGHPEALSVEARGFETCQLHTRHWVITGDREPDHVRGEGVVGKFPVLREGGWRDDAQNRTGRVQAGPEREGVFIYQSKSGRRNGPNATFGGELQFVPGSLEHPTGAEFDVIVKPFPLLDPDFVF